MPDFSLRLPSFFSRDMMLQRDKPVRLFGWSAPGSEVRVRLAWNETTARTRRDGRWTATLPALPAGGPHSLNVSSERERLSFGNILIGDLWLCSGQSNMEFKVERSLTAPTSIRQAKLPLIRHFQVERAVSARPLADVQGRWTVCSPKTVGDFTAVGFYFARDIAAQTGVPVGLIHSSWGGTPIEGWIPGPAYRQHPALRPLLQRQRALRRPTRMLARLFRKWEREQVSVDPGNSGEKKGWAQAGFSDRDWKTMQVPGFWEGRGLFIDGAVWFRRTVAIPQAWAGRDLQLELGPIDDFDETYFNGIRIGGIGKSTPNSYKVPRLYTVPADLVRGGDALLAVRIFDQFGSGGFVGQKEAMRLSCPSLPKARPIPLAGPWRYHIEWAVERYSPVPQPPATPEPRAQLAHLFNGMIHAFTPFPVRGFLWYQGESNAFRAAHYARAFPIMIEAWRKAWGDAALPFYFVQLANFKSCAPKPADDYWAELREAQTAALHLKRTSMAVAIDVGEEEDIHPRNKEAVGQRLARLALARDYGQKIADSGPVLSTIRFHKGEARLTFNHAGVRLRPADGKTLRGFAVAGRNRQWAWATARIANKNTVVLRSPDVRQPVAVRYGWASNPACNLNNSHGLPAAPFRTDSWPLLSEGNIWPF